jgi:hypothetical protein
VSTFPELEAALEAAAQRHYGRRRRWPAWRVLAPAVAVAAAALALLVALPSRTSPPPAPPAQVSEKALALSHALAQAPDPDRDARTPVAHADLAAVAAELRRGIPYPPGVEDRFEWERTPPGPYDMASINYREEVQMLLEFRAGCLWARYWLQADAAGRAAAAEVLADVPRWPYRRSSAAGSPWPEIAAAAARGDAAAVQELQRGDCEGI